MHALLHGAPKECLEVLASGITFVGGLLLSIDALGAKQRYFRDAGVAVALKISDEQGVVFQTEDGKPLREKRYGLRMATRSAALAKWGFALITAGFLVDLVAKAFL